MDDAGPAAAAAELRGIVLSASVSSPTRAIESGVPTGLRRAAPNGTISHADRLKGANRTQPSRSRPPSLPRRSPDDA